MLCEMFTESKKKKKEKRLCGEPVWPVFMGMHRKNSTKPYFVHVSSKFMKLYETRTKCGDLKP